MKFASPASKWAIRHSSATFGDTPLMAPFLERTNCYLGALPPRTTWKWKKSLPTKSALSWCTSRSPRSISACPSLGGSHSSSSPEVRHCADHYYEITDVNCTPLTSAGRLWCLKFYSVPDKKTSALGQWAISLSIINPSPPTWLDSRIIITEPRRKSARLPPWPLPKESAIAPLLPASPPDPRGEKPPIQFRLQTKYHQLQPSASTKMKSGRNELVAYFAENVMSSGLQYPYVYSCFFLLNVLFTL